MQCVVIISKAHYSWEKTNRMQGMGVIFHGPLIFPYISKTVSLICINILGLAGTSAEWKSCTWGWCWLVEIRDEAGFM